MTVDKEVVSSIGKGVLVLTAVAAGDTEKEADTLANKVLRLKLWGDDNGGMVGDPPPLMRPLWLIEWSSGRRT